MDLKDLHLRILNSKKNLIPPHLLTNFEKKVYYENKPRFNGVYLGDNLHNLNNHNLDNLIRWSMCSKS